MATTTDSTLATRYNRIHIPANGMMRIDAQGTPLQWHIEKIDETFHDNRTTRRFRLYPPADPLRGPLQIRGRFANEQPIVPWWMKSFGSVKDHKRVANHDSGFGYRCDRCRTSSHYF